MFILFMQMHKKGRHRFPETLKTYFFFRHYDGSSWTPQFLADTMLIQKLIYVFLNKSTLSDKYKSKKVHKYTCIVCKHILHLNLLCCAAALQCCHFILCKLEKELEDEEDDFNSTEDREASQKTHRATDHAQR